MRSLRKALENGMEGDLTGYISVKENQGQMAKGCSKFDLSTLNVFHLTDCGDGGDDLSQLQLVKDCGFTSCIQSNHENSHLFFAKEAFEEGGEHVTHVGGLGYLTRWDETL